jgi:hypothetical protein
LGVGPIAGQGRGITGDGIEGIHGEQPMGAHQFDEAWAAMVLEDERPWIENGQPREATRHGWGGLPQETPDFMRSQLAQHQRATEGC